MLIINKTSDEAQIRLMTSSRLLNRCHKRRSVTVFAYSLELNELIVVNHTTYV